MGANHQKEIEFLMQYSITRLWLITNFGKAHLEGFGSLKALLKVKSELYNI